MKILPYNLAETNDKLTSRAGLLSVAQLIETLQLSKRADCLLPQPKSNSGFNPSTYVETFLLMQHGGNFHLDDVRDLRDDEALREVMGLEVVPGARALGSWLHRMSNEENRYTTSSGVRGLNQVLLKSALHKRKNLTLDIDATEIVSNKSDAQWTYKKNRGYMPIVGHIAETGQLVSQDFREGNVPPVQENLEFIQQCEASLPKGYCFKRLRIDSAGYQENIIRYCDEKAIDYAIRAKMSPAIRDYIKERVDADWRPLIGRNGKPIANQWTCRTTHCIGDYETAFALVIQRKPMKGQMSLDLSTNNATEELASGVYIYRAIATNQSDKSDSEIVHWYNQRGEDSENRIKELKLDFGGDTLPCSNFHANALYFSLVALSYNLFALMRQLLPGTLHQHRVSTIRWRLYTMAAKVVRTGRQVFVKLQAKHQQRLNDVLMALGRFEPPPI